MSPQTVLPLFSKVQVPLRISSPYFGPLVGPTFIINSQSDSKRMFTLVLSLTQGQPHPAAYSFAHHLGHFSQHKSRLPQSASSASRRMVIHAAIWITCPNAFHLVRARPNPLCPYLVACSLLSLFRLFLFMLDSIRLVRVSPPTCSHQVVSFNIIWDPFRPLHPHPVARSFAQVCSFSVLRARLNPLHPHIVTSMLDHFSNATWLVSFVVPPFV